MFVGMIEFGKFNEKSKMKEMKLARHRHSFTIHHLPKFSYNFWIKLSLHHFVHCLFQKTFSQIFKYILIKKKNNK